LCYGVADPYPQGVPKLWNETVEEHRRAVHVAILDTTAALVAEHGLAAVTMSRIAQETGIGRATLYKYFPDVESIMIAWHDRQIADHLHQLTDAGAHTDDPTERLATVLRTYATLSAGHASHELATVLHRGDHVSRARHHLLAFIGTLVSDARAAGHIRTDVPAQELAAFCVNAIAAVNDLPAGDDRQAAVDRLVTITLAALRPAATTAASRRNR
jgi:AcrR family transcriptional regulator